MKIRYQVLLVFLITGSLQGDMHVTNNTDYTIILHIRYKPSDTTYHFRTKQIEHLKEKLKKNPDDQDAQNQLKNLQAFLAQEYPWTIILQQEMSRRIEGSCIEKVKIEIKNNTHINKQNAEKQLNNYVKDTCLKHLTIDANNTQLEVTAKAKEKQNI